MLSSKILILATTLALACTRGSLAMYKEEAGMYDFVVATTGHGATKYVHANHGSSVVLTSDSPMDAGALMDESSLMETFCTVASRDATTGFLKWRRDVCSRRSTESHSKGQHVTTATDEYVYTMDHVGVLRAWTMAKGDLVWDAPLDGSVVNQPRLWAVGNVVAASTTNNEGLLVLRDGKSGRSLAMFSAAEALKQAKASGSGEATWLHAMQDDDSTKVVKALAGWTSTNKGGYHTTSGGSMALVEIKLDQDGGASLGSTHALKHAEGVFVASSLKFQRVNNEWHAMAVLTDESNIVQFSLSSGFSERVSFPKLHSSWTLIESIISTPQSGVVGVRGKDKDSLSSMGLFQYERTKGWKPLYSVGNDARFEAMAYCPLLELGVALKRDQGLSVIAWSSGAIVTVVGDSSLAVSDPVTSLSLVSCNENAMTSLLSTTLGTTMQLSFAPTKGGVSSDIVWTAEEGLAQVSSALLLDASHSSSIVETHSSDEDMEVMAQLDISSRLTSQWAALTSFGGGVRSGAPKKSDYVFGFIKVAVLLSKSSHRLWGLDTFGSNRGKVRWSLDLPPAASWHSLVHGTSSSTSAVQGANGGIHSREVLVLSSLGETVEWTCIDGTTGAVHATSSVKTPSLVTQVVPLYMTSSHDSTSCRQMALLLHRDNSVSVIPNDDHVTAAAWAELRQSSASKNGLYSHVLTHEQDASMESLQLISSGDGASSMATRVVGQTSFPGERIVGVAYPQRDEVVQSPCTVLGDDSLLLKYLNPHLAAVVTMSDAVVGEDDFSAAFAKSGGTASKRKPLGVTPPGESVQSATDAVEDSPNLFVNVMDTVSGRVLYRASHANAAPSDRVSVLINENWIIYSYFNDKTRRTELGVLSLYEGMIDKKGLTAFSAPEQALSFSSLNAGESKPVVLGKTYGLAKTVTALGVTSTRGGISARHVLVASGDDKIMAIDRRALEPRRPTGEVKEHEKLEGLKKYSPLIPLISLWSPSYNQTVHSVRDIISTSTALESQSLVLAYGGPDIFFTRLAPSKGFDLLPDSFNRSLLALVVFGLVCIMFVVRRMGSRKTFKIGWS